MKKINEKKKKKVNECEQQNEQTNEWDSYDSMCVTAAPTEAASRSCADVKKN